MVLHLHVALVCIFFLAPESCGIIQNVDII